MTVFDEFLEHRRALVAVGGVVLDDHFQAHRVEHAAGVDLVLRQLDAVPLRHAGDSGWATEGDRGADTSDVTGGSTSALGAVAAVAGWLRQRWRPYGGPGAAFRS